MWVRYMINDDEEAYGARPFCCRDCAVNFEPDQGERLTVAVEQMNGNEFPDGVQCEGCGKGIE